MSMQGELARLAETPGASAQKAANILAGTEDKELLGALNAAGGVEGKGIIAACQAMAAINDGDDTKDPLGALASITSFGIGGFAAARALSTRNDDPATASRPWDRDRDGFVLGEGAGVMVIEEYEHAKARGARIYAELSGVGFSGDAFHMTAPDQDGPKRCMLNAMRDAGLNASEVGYINAHGTSTPLGDKNETQAIKAAFGEHAKSVRISSTKSMTGHLLGGAGGLEAVFTVLALHHQVCPPTINIFNQDPECDLDYCANEAKSGSFKAALKNNFGFGGTNGSLVFTRG